MKLRTALLALTLTLLAIPAVGFAAGPEPDKCAPGQTCKQSCDPATETSVTACSADFSYVCCQKNEKLPSGQGGCPKAGQTCTTTGSCASPLVASGDTCLGGTGICCTAPTPASGGGGGGGGSSTVLQDPLKGVGILGVLNRVIQAFLGVAGSIALLVFVYAGVIYMTSSGNEKRVTQAREIMTSAFIGLALILFAYVIAGYYFRVLIGQ